MGHPQAWHRPGSGGQAASGGRGPAAPASLDPHLPSPSVPLTLNPKPTPCELRCDATSSHRRADGSWECPGHILREHGFRDRLYSLKTWGVGGCLSLGTDGSVAHSGAGRRSPWRLQAPVCSLAEQRQKQAAPWHREEGAAVQRLK